MPEPVLDLISIGRSSVDLYGQQIGGRLEDMGSFSKAVGGCPTNIAIGTARLGLKSAVITRVGDEQMGRFILEQLQREGVETKGVVVDPKRLTSLVILGVRDEKTFPLIFYRTDCADAALDESEIDEAFIASAKAVVVTGTHFAIPNAAKAQRKAIAFARKHGRKVVFDVDYRPNLWGLAGHAAGEERYIRSDSVTQHLQAILPECDLIVGTEEELHAAGGSEDTLAAIRNIRALSKATIVCKRGPMGCVVFPGAIPASIEDGIKGPGFPVEVYNVLGAGDAFMSGFLRGYLSDEPIETCCKWANACGAFAVSRLLCSPESPTFAELQFFLKHGSPHRALRHDVAINHVHWATTRRPQAATLMALAIDHRSQVEAMADEAGVPRERIQLFKRLAVDAAARIAEGAEGFGMLLDGRHGREALFRAGDHGFWVARPLEVPGSRPLRLETDADGSLGAALNEWPVDHVAKVLAFYHPDDDAALKAEQEATLKRVALACRQVGRELLVEIICSKNGPVGDDTMASVMRRLYAIGIKPDWWKLEGQPTAAAWAAVDAAIAENDPYCRGVVLLGLDAPLPELELAFRLAQTAKTVKGFAVGRSIFGEAARGWLAGALDDEAATAMMAERFGRLVDAWQAR
ncbi:5-dehydro-2-deoxygluconokinase [Bosea sp. 62]|uniref:bifunctional 5-dehydro-2-deoxygluconokinase/5-dehydro-2- deoxyphosphogluconate aldolase n=1 Tax=unclassified Bosea (in: a-proteobacteria) TaxID=2653178 RepID=UPI00125289A3|nr:MULTISPECIES: 5-dehydro-2-deoxygluconokinase [unclassified Bosea (in: a-proteobacteria)]CAD5251291.1 5-dehydro-2-deoxygluconokinase [Bosea sp. 21B]CAD5262208.1 5-dehydro-2-deoxygluconokinase [Bosea sp. 7B]CAD5272440.1 5-dehydro-2-deoxygluconokinase [Bosea sp. 46]VVT43636.1 5-dehydro-2-deoxygluconokinase [Bosea sp. EC-HK365B]VXB22584.1 5-dehydro-2-deoxygluconokinase [Bosea sp. 29B]